MSLTAGTRLGPYAIVSALGAGGMGEVYRARDSKLERDVAIKCVVGLADQEARAQVLAEARAAAALNHPNICTIHEVADAADPPFIVMEYIDGRRLSDLIGDGLQASTAARYAIQIAAALSHAHARGIVHRDLKAANVMVTGSGQVKVLDFGLARRLDPEESEAVTRSATVSGTPAYLAPEVLRGARGDSRVDLWALGIVLYELIEGHRPFDGSTLYALSSAILRDEAPLLKAPASAPLRLIVQRCLTKEPARRYQRAEEIEAALEAVDTFAMVREIPPPPRETNVFASARKPMVAVLPLANSSADSSNEHFCDGMTEDIIAQLSQIDSLRVISRTSAMRYKNSTLGAREIAAALGASHIVEGSVRRVGDRLRVVARLIEAASDAQLWAHTFDRDLSDVFAVQTEVAERVAEGLRAHLSPDARRRVRKAPTEDQGAYELYLLAKHHANLFTPEELAAASDLYEQAIRRDPRFARAWAALAVAQHWHLAGYYDVRPRDAAARIVEYASKALDIDPEVSEAHTMLAEVESTQRHDWQAAERHHRRALALNPNLAYAHLCYGNHLVTVGKLDEAIEEGQHALELDPVAEIVHVHANWFCYVARRYDLAIRGVEIARAQLGRPVVWWHHVETLALLGRRDEAEALVQELARSPLVFNQSGVAVSLARLGKHVEARQVLRDLHAREGQGYIWPFGIACAYGQLGEMDAAFRYLERSYDERAAWVFFPYAPTLDPFRGDPRFDEFVKRIGAIAPTEATT